MPAVMYLPDPTFGRDIPENVAKTSMAKIIFFINYFSIQYSKSKVVVTPFIPILKLST